ncbi:hypothetical protein TNCV_1275811 [Trichonephila clavipes]|nr:hypothetical protein TNCV_1275811 [Trichonephila clavipes]
MPSLFDETNNLISFLDHFETGLAREQQEIPMDLTMPQLKKKVRKTTGFKVIKPLDLSVHHYCLPCIKIPNLERRVCKTKWFRYKVYWTSVDIGPLSFLEIWVGGRIESCITSKTYLIPSFLTQLWCAHSSVVWKNGDCFYQSLGSDVGQRCRLEILSVGRPPSRLVWDAYQPQNTDTYILDFTDCTRVADMFVKWLTWLDDWEMHRDDNVPWRMVGLQPWKRTLEKHVKRSHEKALANGMQSDVTLLEHI